MRRILAGLVFGSMAAACVAGASGPGAGSTALDPNGASGVGAIHFGDKLDGVGFFDFNVHAGGKPSGTFFFGAEHHAKYPDVVIRMFQLEKVVISGRKLTVRGKGALQETPVYFNAVAVDGAQGQPDTFKIDTFPITGDDEDGHFHAEGVVFSGSLRVGVGES